VLTVEQRHPESGSAEERIRSRAALYTTLTAYAGTYTLTPDGVIHHVEVASFPDWVGRDQVRYTMLDGDTLTIRTPPMPGFPDLRRQVFTLVWRRTE
jgi:Lipocalin-like domain